LALSWHAREGLTPAAVALTEWAAGAAAGSWDRIRPASLHDPSHDHVYPLIDCGLLDSPYEDEALRRRKPQRPQKVVVGPPIRVKCCLNALKSGVTLKSGALVPRSPAQIHDTMTCITTACIALRTSSTSESHLIHVKPHPTSFLRSGHSKDCPQKYPRPLAH
jgi:hypothetical protein